MELKYPLTDLHPGKCSICGLSSDYPPPFSSVLHFGDNFIICINCIKNPEEIEKIKINNRRLYYKIFRVARRIEFHDGLQSINSIKYYRNLEPGKCSICGLPDSLLPFRSVLYFGDNFAICTKCMKNTEELEKIKINDEILYQEIIKESGTLTEEDDGLKNIYEEEYGWIEFHGTRSFNGNPKWLTNLTIDELRTRAREYEKPKNPAPIILNDIPIHENQNLELLEGEIFKTNIDKNIEVSNFGRIKYGDHILKQYDPKNNGYLYVDIKSIRETIPEKVYRLVAETWIERPKPGEFPDAKTFYYNTVHHISNNGYDNRIENLIWVTEWQHAMIHPWVDIKKFNFKELDCLLNSYRVINISPNDYQRIINIAKIHIQPELKQTEGSIQYFNDIIEAIEELKNKVRTNGI